MSQDPSKNSQRDADWIAETRMLSASLRSDLTFTRQIYQGNAVYMVHDPVNFKNHRFTRFDYVVAKELQQGKTLGEVFEGLVECGHIERDDEKSFLQFALKLHSLNLLALPINNGAELFARSEANRTIEKKKKWTSFLFIRIPLTNPDRFLGQTIQLFRWMFTPTFVLIWIMGLLAATAVLIVKRSDLFEPMNGLLAAGNLPFLWLALIGLKVWHELGHGYLCKHFGGRVPEMGAMFLVGNPAAYVDASSAWAFPSKWRRIAVMLGGMFFESIVAIVAIFIWAFSNQPLLSSCAFQIFVMAGFITIFFNANPLMRYDGYFILGELLGIQNLRTQASQQLNAIWKRIFLGIRTPLRKSAKERALLVTFALAALVYRQVLILTIAFVLSYRFPFIGLALAVFHIGNTLIGLTFRIGKYLLYSAETQAIQWRARSVGIGAICLIITVLVLVPMPGGVVVTGLTGFETECSIRARSEGFLETALVQPGQKIEANAVIAQLKNQQIEDEVVTTLVAFQASELEASRYLENNLEEVVRLQPAVQNNHKKLLRQVQHNLELQVRSPLSGMVAQTISKNKKGRMIRVGEKLATLVQGQPTIRAWLNEEQLRSIDSESGSPVQVRVHSNPFATVTGTIVCVQPATKSVLSQEAVTQNGGEKILVDPISKKPLENLYEVQIRLPNAGGEMDSNSIPYGMKASVRFERMRETIGYWAYRQINAFVNKVTADR